MNVDGMHYTIIHTSQPKRAVQVIKTFETYNSIVHAREEKLFLKNLPFEPRVITFTNDTKPRDHVIGYHIELNRKAAVNGDASTYTFWILQKKRRANFKVEKHLRLIDSGAMGGESYIASNVEIQALQDALVVKDVNIEEFDVVKKRKTIDAANESVGVDVTSALLGGDEAAEYFHQFSSEVSNTI